MGNAFYRGYVWPHLMFFVYSYFVSCFEFTVFQRKKFERMAREAMGIYPWVLEESNKSGFDSYSVTNSVLRISHIAFRDCRVHIFSDNLSRNNCIGVFVIPDPPQNVYLKWFQRYEIIGLSSFCHVFSCLSSIPISTYLRCFEVSWVGRISLCTYPHTALR